MDQPIVGDMLVETTYSGYKDFGGVMFPSHIVQKQDGFPSLDLTIASVTANPAVDITVPDNVRGAQPPPVRVDSAKLADGVYYLTGGTHHSLVVEMKDHIVLVDTPKLTDGTRTIELYNLTGYEHTRDMLVVYLPKEKILAEPDAFTPPATPTTPLATSAVPYAAALYDNIQRRKLDVKTIAPFHGGRMTDVPELAKAAGKSSTVTQ